MSTFKELNNYYKTKYGKDFPQATLSRWVSQGKVKATKQSNGRYNYDLDNFIAIINSEDYLTKLNARREKPEDYISRIKGHLLITGIVPKNEYKSNYQGTLMYCDCLNCGNKHIQVRFTYLSDNGNYDQLTCGCGRKVRAFLASARDGITEEFLYEFDDFEKFLFVHKMLTHISDNPYGANCDLEKYKNAIKYFYNDKQFNAFYHFWLNQSYQQTTFYDLSKPSLDHIIPLSRGGTSELNNLQVLTVFENLAKRDMTMEEWNNFKQITQTSSKYFIEEVML